MCNLYTNAHPAAEVAALFCANAPAGANVPGEIYPGYPGLVVREDDGVRIVEQMTWGFPLILADARKRAEAEGRKAKPRPINNARDDKLMTGMWRHWFTTPAQRCLIPFAAFAEAEGEKGMMTRTWFSVADQDVPAWAGLWRPTAEWGASYTGVMCDANAAFVDIHDRMPVILEAGDHDVWLHADADEALKLVRPYAAEQLRVDRTSELWAKRR